MLQLCKHFVLAMLRFAIARRINMYENPQQFEWLAREIEEVDDIRTLRAILIYVIVSQPAGKNEMQLFS